MNESMEVVTTHSHLVDRLRQTFGDEEYRNAYTESFQNSYIAAQIKVLRDTYPLTQAELAEKIGTQQPGVARLENVNYSAWKVETLRKLARALQVRLKISFEEWGTLPTEIEGFKRENLTRRPFAKDPVFSSPPALGLIRDLPPKKDAESDLGGLFPQPKGAAQSLQASGLLEGVS